MEGVMHVIITNYFTKQRNRGWQWEHRKNSARIKEKKDTRVVY